jgi:hypothetical protein
VPILSQLPHDASLLKTQSAASASGSSGSSGSAANNPPPQQASSFNSNNSSSQSSENSSSSTPQLAEEGGENKENLPEPVTEVTIMPSYSTWCSESLHLKYDFQLTAGHRFFCLKHGLAVTVEPWAQKGYVAQAVLGELGYIRI